jgi:hypothetical protein
VFVSNIVQNLVRGSTYYSPESYNVESKIYAQTPVHITDMFSCKIVQDCFVRYVLLILAVVETQVYSFSSIFIIPLYVEPFTKRSCQSFNLQNFDRRIFHVFYTEILYEG